MDRRKPGPMVAIGVLALAFVGCGPAGPRTFELDLVDIQITVIDATGFVAKVQRDFDTGGPPPSSTWVANPEERPDVLRVGWTTRACGHSTLRLEPDGDRTHLTIHTPVDRRCLNDVGVWRSVRLVLNQAVDASTVDVEDVRDT